MLTFSQFVTPGYSVHGILQARILEWGAILFSRGSSRPGDQIWVSCNAGGFFTVWATREAQFVASVQFSCSLVSYLCNSIDCSMPGIPVHHQLLEIAQNYVSWLRDAIELSHLLSSPYPPALNLSKRQGLFKGVTSLHQVAKVGI